MPILIQPGLTDAPEDFWGETDSFVIPGEIFPNQQITVTIVVNNILGGSSPSITFSIDQQSGDGKSWTSIWSSGAISVAGTTGPTVVNPANSATAFDPPELRLSWSTTGTPTQLDFTPTLTAA